MLDCWQILLLLRFPTLRIADIEFCGQGVGISHIIISPIPGFDTVVGDTTLWDPHSSCGHHSPYSLIPTLCGCEITGPVTCRGNAPLDQVTAQYTVTSNTSCTNQPAYVWSDDCTLGDVDQTGLLTIPACHRGRAVHHNCDGYCQYRLLTPANHSSVPCL